MRYEQMKPGQRFKVSGIVYTFLSPEPPKGRFGWGTCSEVESGRVRMVTYLQGSSVIDPNVVLLTCAESLPEED